MHLEIKRKLAHLAVGCCLFILYYLKLLKAWHLFAAAGCGFILALILRKRSLPFISFCLKHLERQKPVIPGMAAVLFSLGLAIAIAVFPKNAAIASIIALGFGDSIAGIVPLMLKKRSPISFNRGKSIEGLIAIFAVTFVLLLPFLSIISCLLAAAFATIADSMPGIDDNLTIPLAAGLPVALLG